MCIRDRFNTVLEPGTGFDLWRRIARQDPSFGRPEKFIGDPEKSNWMSATVTTLDEQIVPYICLLYTSRLVLQHAPSQPPGGVVRGIPRPRRSPGRIGAGSLGRGRLVCCLLYTSRCV